MKVFGKHFKNKKTEVIVLKLKLRYLARAGVIAALYIILTLIAYPISFGPIQFRISEGLTLLPLFFVESIPALFVGCLISNIISSYGIFDIIFGSLTTLVAAVLTWLVGKHIKEHSLRVIIGGIFPVLLNAFIIPLIIVFTSVEEAYWISVATIGGGEALSVYIFGTILYVIIDKHKAQFEIK